MEEPYTKGLNPNASKHAVHKKTNKRGRPKRKNTSTREMPCHVDPTVVRATVNISLYVVRLKVTLKVWIKQTLYASRSRAAWCMYIPTSGSGSGVWQTPRTLNRQYPDSMHTPALNVVRTGLDCLDSLISTSGHGTRLISPLPQYHKNMSDQQLHIAHPRLSCDRVKRGRKLQRRESVRTVSKPHEYTDTWKPSLPSAQPSWRCFYCRTMCVPQENVRLLSVADKCRTR